MIKLFAENVTIFNNNGLGSLNDATACFVSEKLNGEYELEMSYPVDGIHYKDLVLGRIILAKPNTHNQPQPFRIYAISKPINKVVTVNAQHISYDLSGITVKGAVENYAYTVEEVFEYIRKMAIRNHPYIFSSDVTKTGNMCLSKPRSVRSILGTDDNAILSIFGGEYEFDMYDVKLHQHRGTNRGVVIEYGKNLTDLKQEENIKEMYTAVYPYYFVEDDGLQYLDEQIVKIVDNPTRENILTLDLTSNFEEMPTQEVLREEARKYIRDNKLDEPKVSLSVSFVRNDEVTESLQDVRLGDTVTVKFLKLGVNSSSRCISTKFNVISGKYDSIELGEPADTLSDTVAKTVTKQSNMETDIYDTNVKIDNEIERATEEEEVIRSEIIKTNDAIRLDVAAVKSGLESQITLTADSINNRVSNVQAGLESEITQTANGLSARISDNSGNISSLQATNASLVYEMYNDNGKYSVLKRTADSMYSQIFDAYGNSVIQQHANEIALKVSANGVCNAITNSTDGIDISGNRFTVDSTYFKLSRNGYITATGGTIGGFYINSDGLESSEGTRIWKNGVIADVGMFYNFLNTKYIGPPDASGNLRIGSNSGTVTVSSPMTTSEIYINNPGSSSAAPNTRIQDNTRRLAITTQSSRRFKHDISPVYDLALDPHRLYDVGVYQYKYNLDYMDPADQRYDKAVVGFIAEDVYEHYPIAADLGVYGEVNDWNMRFIIPPMLQLIQEQHKEIETLKSSLLTLHGEVSLSKQNKEV